MEKKKAIEIFNKWMDCKDAYQADPSCDGRCHSCEYNTSAEEEKEAMQMAISALEKQEQYEAVLKMPVTTPVNHQLEYWKELAESRGKDKVALAAEVERLRKKYEQT